MFITSIDAMKTEYNNEHQLRFVFNGIAHGITISAYTDKADFVEKLLTLAETIDQDKRLK